MSRVALRLVLLPLLVGLAGCSGDGPPRALPSELPPVQTGPAPSSAGPTSAGPSSAGPSSAGPRSAAPVTPTPAGRTRTVPASTEVFVRSPTGNIVCALSDRAAACEIADRTFTPPPKPADCEFDWGGELSVVPGAGVAEFGCVSDTFSGEPSSTLAYGDTLTNGVVSCTSARTGTTCRTVRGRHGFTVSRAAYRLF